MTPSARCWRARGHPLGHEEQAITETLEQGSMQANQNGVSIFKEVSSESDRGKASQVASQFPALWTLSALTVSTFRKVFKQE